MVTLATVASAAKSKPSKETGQRADSILAQFPPHNSDFVDNPTHLNQTCPNDRYGLASAAYCAVFSNYSVIPGFPHETAPQPTKQETISGGKRNLFLCKVFCLLPEDR